MLALASIASIRGDRRSRYATRRCVSGRSVRAAVQARKSPMPERDDGVCRTVPARSAGTGCAACISRPPRLPQPGPAEANVPRYHRPTTGDDVHRRSSMARNVRADHPSPCPQRTTRGRSSHMIDRTAPSAVTEKVHRLRRLPQQRQPSRFFSWSEGKAHQRRTWSCRAGGAGSRLGRTAPPASSAAMPSAVRP